MDGARLSAGWQGKEQISLRYSVLSPDSRGITHFRDEELPWRPYPIAGVSVTPMRDAEQIGFMRLPNGHSQDWHNAPGKRFVMMLSGMMEVEAGSGEKRIFGPGSVLLVTDVEGQGHRTRALGDAQVVFGWVPVA